MCNGHVEEKQKIVPLQEKVAAPNRSFLRKYQDLVIGRSDILSLVKFEIIMTLFGGLPGGLGFFLRKCSYKPLLNRVGNNVIFGKHIKITNPKKIKVGNNCLIADYCELDVRDKFGEIVIGDNVQIGRNTLIRARNGRIKIGDNSAIGANCILVAREVVLKIENNNLMGPYCYISTGEHEYINKSIPINQQTVNSKPILIEEDVWIGARSTVLGGSEIRRGSVVGACSFVKHEIEEYSVAVGVPARKIGSRT